LIHNRQHFWDRQPQIQVGVSSGLKEAFDMFFDGVRLSTVGTEQIRHRGTHHNSRVVNRQIALRLGNELAIQIRDWLKHHKNPKL
jgi:hypothetical protein